MTFVRFVRSAQSKDFETKINEVIKENQDAALVDIKHGAFHSGQNAVYTAIVIFKETK